jgi:hypothetical protein
MFEFFRKYPLIFVVLIGSVIFLLFMRSTKPEGPSVKSMMAARAICLACRQYSREHNGVFPPSLDTLFPTYMQDRSKLVSPLNPSEPVGYTYTPPPPERTDSPDTIALEDKFAPALLHKRIVSYANGSARILDAQ